MTDESYFASVRTSILPMLVRREPATYWLRVAIDRFTGEVLDQQLEAVYE
jgi:hypothetical protein